MSLELRNLINSCLLNLGWHASESVKVEGLNTIGVIRPREDIPFIVGHEFHGPVGRVNAKDYLVRKPIRIARKRRQHQQRAVAVIIT